MQVLVKILISTMLIVIFILNAQAEDRGFLWGANGHPFTAYPGIDCEKQLDLLHDLGLTSYRVNISRLEDMTRLIDLVRKAEVLDIEILPVLTPALDMDKEEPVDLKRKAYSFAFGVVSGLRGKVRVWELGNELENFAMIRPCEIKDDGGQYNCSWGPAGGVGVLDYQPARWNKVSAVLRGLSEGTKRADPSAQRAMGTAGWGHTGAFQRMQKDGLDWDISVWHMYGQDPEWAFKILAQFGKPIWITEFGNPGGSSDGEGPQADLLVSTMVRLRELSITYNVKGANIYELLDETYWEPSDEARRGLLRLEKSGPASWQVGKPKLAYNTVKSFLRGELENANAYHKDRQSN